MENTKRNIWKLAAEFALELGDQLTANEMRAVIELNGKEKFTGHTSICHTHDFCDANMAMLAAWNRISPLVFHDDDETHCEIWNEAWALAKRYEFNTAVLDVNMMPAYYKHD